jgi:hypothetical protein
MIPAGHICEIVRFRVKGRRLRQSPGVRSPTVREGNFEERFIYTGLQPGVSLLNPIHPRRNTER